MNDDSLSVPDLVDRVVAGSPDALAAVDATTALTYRELAAAAGRVAGVLLEHGVRPGDLVALDLSRSVGYLAAMLGVLRVGAVYVPIDPGEPVRRTRAALAGLDVRLLLTDGIGRFGIGLPQVLLPDLVAADTMTETAGAVSGRAGGASPCYAMFTSGTSGPPKAVLIPHRGVTTLTLRPRFAPLEPGAVVLQLAPLHFDAATFEVWGALVNGATVVVAPQSTLGADELRELIRRYRVSVLHLTAGLFRVIADERLECFAGLRCLLTGGDVVSAAHVRAVLRSFPELRVVACYGPTEGTTFTSVAVLDTAPEGAVPLGEPLPGRRLELLDESMAPVPVGATGELYVGGAGLALGYLGRPAETAERFVPEPNGRRSGERLYRTGDLARRRADGGLEFVRRLDDQVKIRGVRVEPAEVEAALVRHPDVRDAVVRPRGQAGDAVLVCYLTPEPGRRPTDRVLTDFLRRRLPEALIPSAFVTIDQMPTTARGKVDGAALDAIGMNAIGLDAAARTADAAPPVSIEDVVRRTWEECLQRSVGPEENFFEVGGHSLLALRVTARLERALARSVPLRAIFDHATVRGLAERLSEPDSGPPLPLSPSPEPTRETPEAGPGLRPVSPAQRALWFLDNFHPHSSFYVVGLGLRFTGPLDVGALRWALAECVRRQEALRARFLTRDGRPYQVFAPGTPSELPLQDLSARPAHVALRELRTRFEELTDRPFDLMAEAPFRAELVRLGPDRHALLLAIHHIVFDGWSAGVLLTELAAGYSGHVRGDRRQPAPPQPSFGEIAQRQSTALGGEALAETLGRWRRVLAGASTLELPTDLARPGRRGFSGAVAAADIDPEVGRGVRRLAAQLGVSPFTVLVSAFNLLLAQWSGQSDVVIGVPLAGRSDPDTHDLVGFFTNTLPLRVDLGGVRSFRDAVARHRDPVIDLVQDQDLPFPLLVDELGPARVANRNPFYDVTFQHLPAPETGVDFAELTLDLLSNDWHTAQFDLSCDVFDAGDALRVQCEFSTELFSMRTIRGLLDRYVALLREAVDDPDRRHRPRLAAPTPEVAPAPVATAWVPGGIAGIVAGHAARTPEAVAVRCGEMSLSYRMLDEAAARFSAVLAGYGVGPGDRVALVLEPSADAPVALLGVLRTGAAYVPVDPAAPRARVAALLRAAGCSVVVCHPPTRAAVTGLGVTLVEVNLAKVGEAAAGSGEPADIRPDTPAYLMFTSGSSGAPKPVVVPHRAALALGAAAAEVYQIGPSDVVAQLSSLAVDVSVEEYLSAWYAGAGVVVAASLVDLSALVRRYGVTVVNLPAARWHEWARDLTDRGARVPPSLRLMVTGSDRVNPDFVRAWLDGPGAGTRLLNAYGTTETTVSSAWYDTVDYAFDARHTSTVPIGGAFPHARLYVVDEELDPVPDGVPGELCVGGPGVALGYHGDPAATATRFIPDPYSAEPGARMYRTGDRVRRLPTGVLEFLGRADDQVKVRGYRIELGEVEHAAAAVAGVGEFVAVARADRSGAVRLVGYVCTPDEGAAGTSDAVRLRVEQWRDVHDAEPFNQTQADIDPTLNAGGWISSYTMGPIPIEQMREWRDATLERLLVGPVGDVVEIGCGTGMILLPLAAHADRYTGTDISPRALEYVGAQLHRYGLADGRVRLAATPADDLASLDGARPDLVVLNSVVQYFPNEDYLRRVLVGLWGRLRPGGRLFVGDVRDLTTLRLFHLSVLAAWAGGDTEPSALLHAAGERADTESELCVDPRYFHALAADLPDLAAVDVQAKRGRADNEMNRFRYDVTLWRGPLAQAPAPSAQAASVRAVDGTTMDLADLVAYLDGSKGESIAFTGGADARIAEDVALARRLAGDPDPSPAGVHPDDVREAAARAGYAAVVRPSGQGRLDFTLVPAPGRADLAAPDPAAAALDRTALTNDPLRAGRHREIADALHAHLRAVLPEPMVPSRLVFVPEFPRTASGKVDRRRLPDPPARLDPAGRVPPRTELERTLCAAWESVLGLDAVGVRDNFFTIGGDSITWLQVVSRLDRAGLHCEVREIFDHQTIEELAQAMDAPR